MVKADSGKNIAVTQGFIDKLIDKISNILKEQHALKEVDEEQAEEIESLLDKISSIECDFEELTKSLAKGSYPLKLARSIKVAPASIKPQIVPIAIAKSQLISTYNEIPALLSNYINPVNLTPDSYREKNSHGIVLETTIKGNYWAICTQENKQYKYWLVPNSNTSFNIHKIKTFENLFQLKGDYDSSNSEFILEEPAILSLLPDNRQWKLIQPGVLIFGNNLKSKFPQIEQPVTIDNRKQAKINEQTLSSLNSFQKTIELLTNKVTHLEIQSEIVQKSHQREQQKWLSEKETLNIQLKELTDLQSQLLASETKIVTSSNNYELDFVEESDHTHLNRDLHLFDELEKHLDSGAGDRNTNIGSKPINEPQKGSLYDSTSDCKSPEINNYQENYELDNNHNGSYQSFYSLIERGKLEVTKVAIPQETLEKVRSGTQSELKFINERKGNYWIVNWQGVYCLIPKEKLNISPYQYGNFQRVFNCQDYQENYVYFEVIEPAIVVNCDSKTWRLERKGNIKFYPDNQNKIEVANNNHTQVTKADFKTQISQFRQAYIKDRKLINDLIVAKVAISVQTLEQITFYKPDKIILENTPHGKYWIIDYLGNYFLLPSEIQQITNAKETSQTVARLLFHLSGYYPQYSDHHLIRPAIVTKISTNQWELKEKGKFNFS